MAHGLFDLGQGGLAVEGQHAGRAADHQVGRAASDPAVGVLPGAGLLGFEPSSSTQLEDLLYRFQQAEDGRPLTNDDDAALSVKGKAAIRPAGPGLRVLSLRNVPAEFEAKAFLVKAFGALPGAVRQRRLRSDTALYDQAALGEARQALRVVVAAQDGPSTV